MVAVFVVIYCLCLWRSRCVPITIAEPGAIRFATKTITGDNLTPKVLYSDYILDSCIDNDDENAHDDDHDIDDADNHNDPNARS